MPAFRDFVHTQFLLKIPEPSTSFESKTVIVTGANGGLGIEIVKHIVRLGAAKVICAAVACRAAPKPRRLSRTRAHVIPMSSRYGSSTSNLPPLSRHLSSAPKACRA